MYLKKILPALAPQASGVILPWYKPDGVNTSPTAAYRFRGAASYAAAKVNQVTHGTYDADDTGHVPDWAAGVGCTMKATTVATGYFDTGITLANKNYTVICSFNAPMNGYHLFWGAFNASYPTNLFAFARDNTGDRLESWIGKAEYMQSYATSSALANQDHVWAQNINGIYLDGVLATSAGTPGNPAPDDETIYIGTVHYTAGGTPFTYGHAGGVVFHAWAIYPALLSVSEIAAVTNEINKL